MNKGSWAVTEPPGQDFPWPQASLKCLDKLQGLCFLSWMRRGSLPFSLRAPGSAEGSDLQDCSGN